MVETARLDSGAEATLLRQSTVERRGMNKSTGDVTHIVFGNGNMTSTTQRTSIGEMEALICPDDQLQEDLVSINPLLDS